MDFMEEVDAAIDRADWRIYLAEQDRILAELAPITLSTKERDTIKGNFDHWSNWMDNFGQPLGFATYVEAWLHCLEAHSSRRSSAATRLDAGRAPMETNQDAPPANAGSVYGVCEQLRVCTHAVEGRSS